MKKFLFAIMFIAIVCSSPYVLAASASDWEFRNTAWDAPIAALAQGSFALYGDFNLGWKVTITFTVTEATGGNFSSKSNTPLQSLDIAFFVCDLATYDNWYAGGTPAVNLHIGIVSSWTGEFAFPYDAEWHFVFDNSYSDYAKTVDVQMDSYEWVGTSPPPGPAPPGIPLFLIIGAAAAVIIIVVVVVVVVVVVRRKRQTEFDSGV